MKNWKDIMIFANLKMWFYSNNDEIKSISLCVYKNKQKFKTIRKSKIKINDILCSTSFLFKKGIKIPFLNLYINIYKFVLSKKEVLNYPIQNKVFLEYNNFEIPIIYSAIYLKKGKEKHCKLNFIKNNTIYFRQSIKNALYLTVRKKNITDQKQKRFLIFLAYIISKFMTKSKDILLYEKETNRYEESGSIVYEKLIDKGYNNVFFIINENSFQFNLIKPKYLKNIVKAHTFKHYYKFFRCQKFISSESLQHSLELRVANKYVGNKFRNKKFKYIFLQHGVMYMISIDSNNRSFFRKDTSMPKDAKIVVSSKKEAKHFIDQGGFEEKDFYITGLPKFDKSKLNKNPKKIVIMPTWRPWEYNEIRNNFKKAGYYKMIMEIISSMSNELKKQIVVLPHPLINDFLTKTDLREFIPKITSYDKILKTAKILITDYSSISFDSFYRGSNIIFWWKEKDRCLNKYNGKLMLKENEAFGDICYNVEELKKSIEKNYKIKQELKYKNRFKKIVNFNDNKNTERLVKELKKDKII